VTDGPGDGGALGHAGADRDRHTDRVGDLAGGLHSPGVAHPPGLSVAVGGRGSNRGSSVSSSVESISISLSLSLTLANVVVDKTSSVVADSLHSSSNTGNTGNTSNTGNTDSSRGDSNAGNTRSASNNVGRVGNADGGLGADLLGDVLAVLDGGGVNNGGDFVVALLLLVALLHLSTLLLGHLSAVLLGHLLTLLFLDYINHVVALWLLSRGADLLSHWPRDSLALLHGPAAALLLSPGLGLGDGPGVADGLGDSGALLGGDGVVGGLAVRGSDGPLGDSNRGSGDSNRGSSNTSTVADGTDTSGTSVAKSSSVDAVAGLSLSLSQSEGGKESKENHKLLHDELIGLPTVAD